MSYLYAKQKLVTPSKLWKEIDSGENWNYQGSCNWCKKGPKFWNPNIINLKTGKKMVLDEPFTPHTGMIPKVHYGCMKQVESKQYVKDGKVIETEQPEWVKPHWTFESQITQHEHIMYKVLKSRNRILKWGDIDSVTYLQPVPSSWYAYCFEY